MSEYFVDGLKYRKIKFDFIRREMRYAYSFVIEITPQKAKELCDELLDAFCYYKLNIPEDTLSKHLKNKGYNVYHFKKNIEKYDFNKNKFKEKDLLKSYMHEKNVKSLYGETINIFAEDADYHYLLLNHSYETNDDYNDLHGYVLFSKRELSQNDDTKYDYNIICQKAFFNDELQDFTYSFNMNHLSQLDNRSEIYQERDVRHMEFGNNSLIIPIYFPQKNIEDNLWTEIKILKNIKTTKTKEEILAIVKNEK